MKQGPNGKVFNEQLLRKHALRQQRVLSLLKKYKVKSILDIGSGDGQFLDLILKQPQIKKYVGIEPSKKSFQQSKQYKKDSTKIVALKNMSIFDVQKKYFAEHPVDAVTAIEVIEHIDRKRIPRFNHILFEEIKPKYAIITTPNASFRLNRKILRKLDHKFEWNEQECDTWGNAIAVRYGYIFKRMLLKNKLFIRGTHICLFTLNS